MVVGLLRFSLFAYILVYQVSDRLSKLKAQYCSIYIILNKNMFNIYYFILNANGNNFSVRVLNYFYLFLTPLFRFLTMITNYLLQVKYNFGNIKFYNFFMNYRYFP